MEKVNAKCDNCRKETTQVVLHTMEIESKLGNWKRKIVRCEVCGFQPNVAFEEVKRKNEVFDG